MTPLLLAASISITSGWSPWVIALQLGHSLHGGWSPVQLIALANILAIVVFPVPRGPANK